MRIVSACDVVIARRAGAASSDNSSLKRTCKNLQAPNTVPAKKLNNHCLRQRRNCLVSETIITATPAINVGIEPTGLRVRDNIESINVGLESAFRPRL